MATIIGDDGREIEVIPTHAVATLASTSALGKELPVNAAERIQQAMANAVAFAYSKGIDNPEEIRELMMLAREEEKKKLFSAPEDRTKK